MYLSPDGRQKYDNGLSVSSPQGHALSQEERKRERGRRRRREFLAFYVVPRLASLSLRLRKTTLLQPLGVLIKISHTYIRMHA
jgi:hypothetical protein